MRAVSYAVPRRQRERCDFLSRHQLLSSVTQGEKCPKQSVYIARSLGTVIPPYID